MSRSKTCSKVSRKGPEHSVLYHAFLEGLTKPLPSVGGALQLTSLVSHPNDCRKMCVFLEKLRQLMAGVIASFGVMES
mgnify:CR=1 FL=1